MKKLEGTVVGVVAADVTVAVAELVVVQQFVRHAKQFGHTEPGAHALEFHAVAGPGDQQRPGVQATGALTQAGPG